MKPEVIGKSIDLWPMNEEDLELVRAWRNSDEVSSFMLSREIISKEQQGLWFEGVKYSKEHKYWVIRSKQNEKLGVVSLNRIDLKDKVAEPGLYIGEAKNRNSFYGMEAYYYALKFGFEVLHLEKYFGTVLLSNKVAFKMNKSFGYVSDEPLETESSENSKPLKIHLLKQAFYKSQMVRFFVKANKGFVP